MSEEEENFVKLKEEMDEIVRMHPKLSDRTTEITKRLKSLKNKYYKNVGKFQHLMVPKHTATDQQRKAKQRASMDAECKANEEVKNKERMSSIENKKRNTERMSSNENREKTKQRLAQSENREKTKQRLAQSDYKKRNAERMSSNENKQKTRNRLKGTRYKLADKKRKAKRRNEKKLREERPQPPALKDFTVRSDGHIVSSMFPGDQAEPQEVTCLVGKSLDFSINISSFPATTFLWMKNGQPFEGCSEVCGGTKAEMRRIKKLENNEEEGESSGTNEETSGHSSDSTTGSSFSSYAFAVKIKSLQKFKSTLTVYLHQV